MIRLKMNEVPFMEEIEEHLSRGPVGLIHLDIVALNRLEAQEGRIFRERLLLEMDAAIEEVKREIPSVINHGTIGDDLFVYLGMPIGESEDDSAKRADDYRKLIKAYVEKRLRERFHPESPVILHAGFAVVRQESGKDIGKLIYQSIKMSIRNANDQSQHAAEQSHSEAFHRILHDQLITTVYQPIVDLNTCAVFGYEALTRGPADSPFHSPLAMFDYASRAGHLYMLDKLAREKAIKGSAGMRNDQRLFINIPSDIMNHPEFTPGRTMKLLHEVGLQPRNIVFEITERSSIEDFSTAKRVLQHYRSQGYQIAIDDAGSGYSSLQAIAEIEPDYIKVDRSLIQGIHADRVKEYILETFVNFAEKLNIRIIAEGIELTEDLEKLLSLGVHYAQGYLLGKPNAMLADSIDPALCEVIRRRKRRSNNYVRGLTIGEIAVRAANFESTTHCSEVTNFFRMNDDALGAVIVSSKVPVGLVMREKLFQKLAEQFGISLYWNKPITHLMDGNPLIVDASMTLEEVSRLAMARDRYSVYNLVIVTSGGLLSGIASIQSILESLAQQRTELARISNPLTGLPGNLQIQREMSDRLSKMEPFHVIYGDLDYFKWFNDCYGFQKGDELIQFVAKIMMEGMERFGSPHDFVGHIGGDDFIIITAADDPDRLCGWLIDSFDRGVDSFYNGQVEFVHDRQGNVIDTNGVTLSLSMIVCNDFSGVAPESISRKAAQLKKHAKEHRGSIYVKGTLSSLK